MRAVLLVLVAVAAVAALESPLVMTRKVSSLNGSAVDVILNAPPRYMWGWGPGLSGYCGETSFQTNGIFWGEWISSEQVRIADGNAELLVAVNDAKAAKNLKMTYEQWDYESSNPQAPKFIAWLRGHIDQGHLAAIGVFEKMKNGDPDYDHIVPVVGYQYDASSGVTNGIWFNDLYGAQSRFLSASTGVTSRSGCAQSTAPSQPFTYCIPNSVDYGIAFTGIQDTKSETFRTFLTMPSWTEPDYGKEDKIYAKPVIFNVTATVAGLSAGHTYAVLRFDSYSTLPTSNFLSGPYTKRFNFVANSSSEVLSQFDSFLSNGTIFYRTVRTA